MARKVPKGWRMKTLAEMASFNRSSLPESFDPEKWIQYFDVSSAGQGEEGAESVSKIQFKHAPSRARRLAAPGDVVYATVRPLLRRIFLAKDVENAVYSTGYSILHPKQGCISGFLLYCLQENYVESQISAACTGSGYPAISDADLKKVRIVVPEIDEQRRIVAVLDACDCQLRLSHVLYDDAKRRYDGLLQQLMRPVEQKRAHGWRRVLLREAFFERDERSDALPLLAISGAHGVVPRDTLDRRETAAEDKSNYKVIREGDIGYNTMRMWQGVFGLSRYDGIVSPAYTVVTPERTVIDGEFASHLFAHPRVIHTFHRYSQGLVDDTLLLKYQHFAEIRLPLPDVPTQKAIAKPLTVLQRELDRRAALIESAQRQKRGLMQLLLSGEKRLLRDLPGIEIVA